MDKDFFFKILFEAIEGGNNISINRTADKEELFHFSSRFFKFDDENSTIMIDLPSSEEDGTLRMNDIIEVFFISQNLRLGFFSKVIGFSEFQLASKQIVPALIISKPDEGLDLQRRRDFRVPTTPLKVVTTYIREDDENKKEIINTCICDDISRSGIALTENKELKEKLKFEKGIYINMKINMDEEIIQMEGRIESKRELYEGKKIIFGIDFAENKPDKLQYKKNIRIIMKYIMKRQREIMFKV